jgi:heme/copper-type cytochrome/quinol oxidase subunit 3
VTAVPVSEIALTDRPDARTRDIGWWGMALLCATEGSLFAYLIASYLYLGTSNRGWPPAGIELPALSLPLVMMVVLLASSLVLRWGEQGIRAGDVRRLRVGIGGSLVLGLVFLALQVVEYQDKLRHFGPTTHAYASLFYTITGFHGAHVTLGLLMLAFTGVRASLGHFTARGYQGVSNVALYWHFVDGVWVAIVAVLYVSPYLY